MLKRRKIQSGSQSPKQLDMFSAPSTLRHDRADEPRDHSGPPLPGLVEGSSAAVTKGAELVSKLAAISELTGGPLNASEAQRAICGMPIRVVGFLFTKSRNVVCRECRDVSMAKTKSSYPSQFAGQGPMATIYQFNDGADANLKAECGLCFTGVIGDVDR